MTTNDDKRSKIQNGDVVILDQMNTMDTFSDKWNILFLGLKVSGKYKFVESGLSI